LNNGGILIDRKTGESEECPVAFCHVNLLELNPSLCEELWHSPVCVSLRYFMSLMCNFLFSETAEEGAEG
jgi:hypothetical protein